MLFCSDGEMPEGDIRILFAKLPGSIKKKWKNLFLRFFYLLTVDFLNKKLYTK